MNVRVAKQIGGFTLLELLVSLMLASFIAVTSVGALRAVAIRSKIGRMRWRNFDLRRVK